MDDSSDPDFIPLHTVHDAIDAVDYLPTIRAIDFGDDPA